VITHELDIDYQSRTYEELSNEFQNLYTSAIRAFQLIPAMYNRLTLVNKLTHKEALERMRDDHKHLPGFSMRNLYRYLPSDNPNIPRRVVTPRHKNTEIKIDTAGQLGVAKEEGTKVESVDGQNHNYEKEIRIQELEDNLNQHDYDLKDNVFQNAGLSTQVKFREQLRLSNNPNNVDKLPCNHDVVDFEFRLSWETVREYMSLTFKSGRTLEVWFHGRFHKLTGKIIEVYPGRKSDLKGFTHSLGKGVSNI